MRTHPQTQNQNEAEVGIFCYTYSSQMMPNVDYSLFAD